MNTFLTPDLIFFALVAAFLILKLRSVLGRRTGNEKRPKNFFMQEATSLGTEKKKIIKKREISYKSPKKYTTWLRFGRGFFKCSQFIKFF